MSLKLRIILLLGALITAIWILRKIHKNHVRQEDALFWICFAILLALVGLFPQIAYFFAGLFEIQSPANFVFMAIIALLAEKILSLSMQISTLENRVENLVAEVAINNKKISEIEEKE